MYDPVAVRSSVIARCRRDGGPLYLVIGTSPDGKRYEEALPPGYALSQAKDLVRNGFADVTLTSATGQDFSLDADEILAARY
jgi:hypothetical protein